MGGSDSRSLLPVPPEPLAFGDVRLCFECIVPGDASRGFVPYYHFRVVTCDGTDVGHLNFRVGDTEHVRLLAGHIGFQIHEAHRGHAYAQQACRAVAPLVRSTMDQAMITCNPENVASRRTIERLGATFLDEVAAPLPDAGASGATQLKRRYIWRP